MGNYEDFPSYSCDGGAARDIFLSDYFDLFFYFEDEGQEYIYEQLLIKIGIKPRYAVICTGGKTKFKELSKEPSDKKRIFICDKDFDDITGEAKAYGDEQFVYLGRFCFENYLITEQAFSGLLCEKLKKTTLDILPKLQYKKYWEILIAQYEKLSRLYAISRTYRVPIKTTKTDAADLIKSCTDYFLAPTEEYIESFRTNILEQSLTKGIWITERNLLPQLEENAFISKQEYRDISDNSETSNLCGKHLLRMLILQADKVFGSQIYNGDFQDIYSRLISHSDPASFESIRISIEKSLET
ncbi:DUF4435 domain-containing protein [Pseudomonas viridiflava]|uniref:DUF4435 domain-containing protein n=1 Tax=Pseudomonas viridiflava TaxID=33069 RepID=UPI0013DD0DFE|nr:DUF4435 domain-containing protein [Pseudomonas viridiflava]